MGALRPGYVLVAPKVHRYSLAEMPAAHRHEFLATLEFVKETLTRNFGPVLMFEHGGDAACRRRSACVEHAHLHVWSIADEIHLRLPDTPVSVHPSLDDFLQRPSRISPYLLHVRGDGRTAVGRDPGISQFFRRQIAEQLAVPSLWDYATVPCWDNVRAAVRAFDATAGHPGGGEN
ncbi:hypothetical protein EIY87_22160 [Amycolatopsis eburnea]|uniref:HIT domain-containing protein n=1 Tax=Amycolatopsis eburnea TaxID=2267691 RepID=A0A3R9DYQ4_9PSEU|nr:hypothetical protein EIY87_22160 [Amycolatopsis eburnea]